MGFPGQSMDELVLEEPEDEEMDEEYQNGIDEEENGVSNDDDENAETESKQNIFLFKHIKQFSSH